MVKSNNFKSVTINSNSLDFISLIAALDVMIAHTSVYILGNGSGAGIPFWRVIAPGPSVVVFFTISGFLTMASFEHSKSVLNYYVKRVARIYPALICAIVLPIIIYVLCGSISVEPLEFIKFIFKKIITGRGGGYNPVGAIGNGSLWTIFIQIQFYILTPFLSFYLNRVSKLIHFWTIVILVFLNLFTPVLCNIFPLGLGNLYKNNCIPYLYMYVLGAVLYINRKEVIPVLTNRIMVFSLCALYVIWHYVLGADFWINWTYINPVSGVVAGLICISLGFYFGRHRAPIDFSYGLFLWHLPVMDILHTVIGIEYSLGMLVMTWGISIIVAIISFIIIEKPIMQIVRKH